nr:tetratricopeptide repeat protein [Gammaproteobacteria bacterium]NIT15042.1 tetratricopeptide repeat protein [Gammaproteobacteria bacterium]
RIVKLIGDGTLVEFPSVVEAVECALAVQKALVQKGGPIQLRIGINLGDVIVEGDDIYGDGVNVAARLEALAEPGGICISGIVQESLGNRVAAVFSDAGAQEVRGIPRPIRIWRWAPEGVAAAAPVALSLPEKPSIAILPFDNMSHDPDQDFFAEGIAEDIITELSKFRSLFVIARNSSFAFKGQGLELKEIGRRLGVRYIVEGSVRRAGNRVRITAQLIDAVDDVHLWAERYDRNLEDIFAMQDEVTHAIVTTIEPHLADTERQRARRKPPESLDAWEAYQRGLWHLYQYTREDIPRGLSFMECAVALDPGFAPAQAGLALALYMQVLDGVSKDRGGDLQRALAAGRVAVQRDPSDPFAHTALARVYNTYGEHDAAIEHCDRAIGLNPSYASAHFGRARTLWLAGRPEEALSSIDEAMRLSPKDPMTTAFMTGRSISFTLMGHYEEALAWARRAVRQPNAVLFASVAELAALGWLGRSDEADMALERVRSFKPDADIQYVLSVHPITEAECRERFVAGLRKAGLSE